MDYEWKSRLEPGFSDSKSSALFNTQETKDWGINRATTGFLLDVELYQT